MKQKKKRVKTSRKKQIIADVSSECQITPYYFRYYRSRVIARNTFVCKLRSRGRVQ